MSTNHPATAVSGRECKAPTNGGAFIRRTGDNCNPVKGFNENPFSYETPGNKVKFFTTGEEYFKDVSAAMKKAEKSIFITGWQIDFDVILQSGERLFDCLREALDKNKELHIYVLPWASPKVPVDTHDLETLCALSLLNAGVEDELTDKEKEADIKKAEAENKNSPEKTPIFSIDGDYAHKRKAERKMRVHVLPALSQADHETLAIGFSHHQKSVVIDNKIAYVGGIDLAYGRRDDNSYSLDWGGRGGRERYNPCVPPTDTIEGSETRHYLTTGELISSVALEGDGLSQMVRAGKAMQSKAGELKEAVGEMSEEAGERFIDWVYDDRAMLKFGVAAPMSAVNLLLMRNMLKAAFGDKKPTVKDIGEKIKDIDRKVKDKQWEVGDWLRRQASEWLKNSDAEMPESFSKFLLKGVPGTVLGMLDDELALVLGYLSNCSLDGIPPEKLEKATDVLAAAGMRLYAMCLYLSDTQGKKYSYLLDKCPENANGFYTLMPPGGKVHADIQPRMPWHDVHCRVDGPTAFDLSMNFVRRWNGMQSRLAAKAAEGEASAAEWLDRLHALIGLPGAKDIKEAIRARIAELASSAQKLAKRELEKAASGAPAEAGLLDRAKGWIPFAPSAPSQPAQQNARREIEARLKKLEEAGVTLRTSAAQILGTLGPQAEAGKVAQAGERIQAAIDRYKAEAAALLEAFKKKHGITDDDLREARKSAETVWRAAKTVSNAAEKGLEIGARHGAKLKGGLVGVAAGVAIYFIEEAADAAKRYVGVAAQRLRAACAARLAPHYIPEAHLPIENDAEKPGTWQLQVLRSAPKKMLEDELAALHALGGEMAAKERERVYFRAPEGEPSLPVPADPKALKKFAAEGRLRSQDNCHEAMCAAIASSTRFVYIEGQFFQGDYGPDGKCDTKVASGPMASLTDPARLAGLERWVPELVAAGALPKEGGAPPALGRLLERLPPKLAVRIWLEEPGLFAQLKMAAANQGKIEAAGRLAGPAPGPGNRVLDALASRLERAVMGDDGFHAYLVLPVHPEGSLGDFSLMTQVHLTMQSLFSAEGSLVGRVQRAIYVKKHMDKARDACPKGMKFDAGAARQAALADYGKLDRAKLEEEVPEAAWMRHVTVLNLRNWAEKDIGGKKTPVTEQVYVHSKLLVVDDRIAVLGSANINDRSLLGDRDSELALALSDGEKVRARLNGRDEEEVSAGIQRLRMDLWRKHFGLGLAPAPGGKLRVSPAKALESVLDKPAAPEAWEAVNAVALENLRLYSDAFHYLPRNDGKEGAGQIVSPPEQESQEAGAGGQAGRSGEKRFPYPKNLARPQQGKRGASIWPGWAYADIYKHKTAGSKMLFWHPFEEAFWQDDEKRRDAARAAGTGAARVEMRPRPPVSEPAGEIRGFIVAMPWLWTAGECNDSGLSRWLVADAGKKMEEMLGGPRKAFADAGGAKDGTDRGTA